MVLLLGGISTVPFLGIAEILNVPLPTSFQKTGSVFTDEDNMRPCVY